ncbi:hypothetical protein COHA_006673 [Chlorella ohadii]|uniref:Glycosyltransferase 2-like domain-containing protein n=1 Tax=Chlorella ohadii TaxID=2649997 RepID=A0AAD5DMC9_9CHLO|nr:hypothetical protein COHA_006673 [Chlorella ohadii]
MPGDGGYSSSSGSGGGGARLRCPSPLLCTAAGWAAVTEAWALLQYRGMRQRDEQRRADLFHAGGSSNAPQPAATVAAPGAVSIIVPALNEAAGIEPLLTYLQQSLQPEAAEIIVVDGGSSDATVAIAQRCGVRVVQAGRGRARQMNVGAAAAAGDILVFVHADARPPQQLVSLVRAALWQPGVVLGGFRPLIEYEGRPLRFFSANNTLKSYYLPLLLRPLSFLRGLRILFGDQTLFCRAADFRKAADIPSVQMRVGGYDSRLPIMEDADLCLRLHMAGPASQPGRRGRIVQINSPPNCTSGRRLVSWGQVHATVVHAIIGVSWYLGASPQQLVALYRRLYTDVYR